MFKLLVVTAIVAVGTTSAASEIDQFFGDWFAAEIWPGDARVLCEPFKIQSLRRTVKCDGKDLTEVRIANYVGNVDAPVLVVNTHEEAMDAAVNMKCEGHGFYIFRRLNDNYINVDLVARGSEDQREVIRVLYAKSPPTKEELSEFVSKTVGLKEMEGSPLCTKEKLTKAHNHLASTVKPTHKL